MSAAVYIYPKDSTALLGDMGRAGGSVHLARAAKETESRKTKDGETESKRERVARVNGKVYFSCVALARPLPGCGACVEAQPCFGAVALWKCMPSGALAPPRLRG